MLQQQSNWKVTRKLSMSQIIKFTSTAIDGKKARSSLQLQESSMWSTDH